MNLGTMTVTLGLDASALIGASSEMTKSLNNVSQKFRTFGYLASATLTAPMVMAGKAAFNMAKEYEFSIQKIVGLTGVAQSEVDKWSQQILKMGPTLGKSPQELADALYFISSSGIKGAEAMSVLELSAKAAASGLGETKAVADTLTSALNAYKGTGLTAAYATDVLVAAVRVGKAEASSFSTAIGQLIPIAANAGVSFDQVAGGMAAITLTGSSAASAAVYLKGVFNSLITAGEQGDKALASVGLSYAELRKILATGPEGLINVMQKFRDVQMALGDEAIKDVLPNIRGMTAFMSIAGKNFQYNTQIMREVTNATGSLSVAFAAVADTIKIRFDRAIAQSQTSMITLGSSIATSFLPLLEKAVEKLTSVTEWFNALSEEQKRHKLTILAWVAAAGPIALLFSVTGYAVSAFISTVSALHATLKYGRLIILAWTGSLKAAEGAMAMNKGLTYALLNPYVLALAAVTALAAGYLLLRNRINEATEASEREKAFREGEKQEAKNVKGIFERYDVLGMGDKEGLSRWRDDANQELVILKDKRAELAILRKKWIEEDKTYAILKDKVALSSKTAASMSKWGVSRDATTIANIQLAKDKKALIDYEKTYTTNLDASSKTMETQITNLEWKLGIVNQGIKAIEDEETVAKKALETELLKGEALKVVNEKIREITTSVQDEIKYTDALALVMKTLGIEYDITGTKAGIYLDAINKLTKEGLSVNSKEVQDQIKLYQDLRKSITENPIVKAKMDNLSMPDIIGKRKKGALGVSDLGINNKLAGAPNTSLLDAMTILENSHEMALMSEKEFLKKKYTLQIAAAIKAGKDTSLITYQYNKAMQELSLENARRGLQIGLSFVTSLGDLVESQKQRELSAAGDNAHKRENIEKEYFEKQKKYAIAQAIINGALAVVTSLTGPPIYKWIEAASVMAATAAQVAIISAQGMKKGGVVPSGYPNDSYPAMLTSGETVIPPNKLGNIGRQGSLSEQLKDVVFHIEGTQLVGVFKNQARVVSSYS